MYICINEALHEDTALLLVVFIPKELIADKCDPMSFVLLSLRLQITLSLKDRMI
jgi:hypothetical protein